VNIPHGWELILVLLVVVMVFGYKRLPDSARAVGRSMRILKAETKGLRDDDTPATTTTTTAHVVEPVLPPTPVQPSPRPTQAYSGQQLFDANGNPVTLPVNGSTPVPPAEHPSRTQA
jgi:sec-independent protein translocase protein TatA